MLNARSIKILGIKQRLHFCVILDRDICKKWILKLCNLKSNDAVVKRNRNHFFRYLLQIMHKGTIGTKHLEHQEGFLQYDKKMTEGKEGAPQKFMCRWSPDKRTYVAAKPLPGQGALVYMAVARDPLLGWDHSATPS